MKERIMSEGKTPGRARRGLRIGLMAVLLAGTALGGYAAGDVGFAATGPQNTFPSQTAIQPQVPISHLPDFSQLVKQVKPAVVSITTSLRASAAADMEGGAPQLPFPFNQMFPPGQSSHPRAIEARGSGFIIDPDGTIVTNNHVVKDAKSVSVTLEDGTKLPAKVIGTDPRTDVAVLRVKADHPLPYLRLGDSSKIEAGQWVVAVGNPFGLGGTVTAGIVSARGRDIGEGPYDNFIQIDAPINRGNSGGPLFDQEGEVVGINTAILSPTGGSVGIGFAIPSNTVKTVVAQLEKSGHVTRGFLGVEAQAITDGMTSALNLKAKTGALVASVEPDSPAAHAGLQPGDVITSVNGDEVKNPRDLAVDIAAVKPGDEAKLGVTRNGEVQSMSVKVATMPNQMASNDSGNGSAEQQGQARVGLALAPLTPDMRSQLDIPAHTSGAVVAGVTSGSPADAAGLQPGDVVIGVGDKAVHNPSEAAHAIRDAARHDKSLALRIMRNGHAVFVALNLNQPGNDAGNSQG
jgi:serine protease Do